MASRMMYFRRIRSYVSLSADRKEDFMILLKNAICVGGDGKPTSVLISGNKVAAVGQIPNDALPECVIDCDGGILSPGFVNAHTHVPMTLLRGIGSDVKLQTWLEDYIYPAEDRLDGESAYIGSLAAVAEMLRGGVTSFSDMYFFCESIAKSVIDTGIRARLSRSIVSFDESANPEGDQRVAEGEALVRDFNGAADGRLSADFSLHAEYTNTEKMSRYVAKLAQKYGTGIQLHLCESEKEVAEGISRRGMTPVMFFKKCGVFDVPVCAAHSVWLTYEDIAVLSESNATVVHNPRSNLKLASGVMPYRRLHDAGVNIALGSDGSASNNKLDVISEMQLAALLHKGIERDASIVPAAEAYLAATSGGMIAQGRTPTSAITVGMTADLTLISTQSAGMWGVLDPVSEIVYSASRDDVVLTMVDGRVLYERGEYTTIDIERLRFDYENTRKKILGYGGCK